MNLAKVSIQSGVERSNNKCWLAVAIHAVVKNPARNRDE